MGQIQFGVFLALGQAQRQGDRRQHDHRLPAPEREGRQPVGNQPHVAGALHHVVGLVANRAQPPKAKITALVCSGRNRP